MDIHIKKEEVTAFSFLLSPQILAEIKEELKLNNGEQNYASSKTLNTLLEAIKHTVVRESGFIRKATFPGFPDGTFE